MRYLSLEHRIIRYFGKYEGVITLAHLKCLVPKGNDYEDLCEIQVQQVAGNHPIQIIPLTDAEFDIDLVRALFVERFGDTPEQFDAALASVRAAGYMDSQKLVATKKCRDKHAEIEGQRRAKMVELDITDEKRGKGQVTRKQKEQLEALEYTF